MNTLIVDQNYISTHICLIFSEADPKLWETLTTKFKEVLNLSFEKTKDAVWKLKLPKSPNRIQVHSYLVEWCRDCGFELTHFQSDRDVLHFIFERKQNSNQK
ncbi:hypothetical protein M0811_11833 [Anaeramoeba ignava]|uniref:Uncharacterized protein n=1 Tax=Anaeramoeba ignava TaxID=1746090 RepID=A0A9Q0LDD5_ANAIG|nr:hypothetical protein M0811_11833 [Anaeramoeba ignava]